MFSNIDVGKSKIFKSVSLINTVTCVKFVGSFLLAGIGNVLLIFDIEDRELCGRKQIFDKATIHGIQFNAEETLLLIHGEKNVAVYMINTQNGFHLQFECILMTTDWVCNVLWMNCNLLLTISAHNVATVWNYDLKKEVNSSCCDEQCILYSATSVGDDEENIIIFSGTVFSEIIIWSPFRESNDSNILHRLKKHNGVIFSIMVNKCHSVISSTSDDRSIVIWNVESSVAEFKNAYDYWKNAKITPNYSLYAHKARVWKSIIMESGNILSAGEDGQICLKTPTITYQWEESRGSQVRSLDCMETNNLMASGCTTGSVGLWSLNMFPKREIVVDYKISKHYPKHLVVFSNTDTYVLYSNGQVVYYKKNISHDVYQNVILCCTLTMIKSPCETKISFTTSSGHIVILKTIGEICFQIFIDQISPVKINSSVWLNPNQIILSCEGNMIYLYNYLHELQLLQASIFIIDSKTSSWITVATIIDCLIFAGCNEGSIYLFKLCQTKSLQVFSKVHSFAGVTALWTHEKYSDSTIISSVGRDGHHRYWKVCTKSETMVEMRCEILPTKWPFIITNSNDHGLLICGFKEKNLIVYSSMEQRILATIFCGGGHRTWDLTFVDNYESIYFVCSSSNSQLEIKEIPLNGQHMLLNGFHSMIINSMAIVNNDLMVTGSDDTTIRLTRFNNKIVHLLTLRSHISSVRSISCLTLKPNLYIIVTVGGRAQLKIWTLNIIDGEVIYCEESVSYLLKSNPGKKPWRTVVPTNEGETRFMDVCVQYTKSKSILISVGCSDAILRLYKYDTCNKTFNLIVESLDLNRCILKISKVQLNTFDYVLTADTKGSIHFWDISKYIENSEVDSTFTPKYEHCLHQSGINCFDWLNLENNYGLLATGGDDQSLNLSVMHYKDTLTLKSSVSIYVHCSQVTGVKVFNGFVISTSVDQKIIFSSWSFDLIGESVQVSPLASYFTTVADIHGLIAQQIGNQVKVIVYGQGVETFFADMSSADPSTPQTAINIEAVTPALQLGEGPHWDVPTQSLYFVDLHKSKIHKYHPETNGYFSALIGGGYNGPVSFVIPVQGQIDTYSVGLRESIGVVKWDGISAETSEPEYVKVIDKTSGVRLNDAKADASGRLWLGTMGGEMKDNAGHYYKHQGSLFSLEKDGTIVKRLANVSISNGLAWSLDNKEFYYIDTYNFEVEAYDFDIISGELFNRRVIFNLPDNKIDGDPDGMTIDTDGNLWVACFNSDNILKIDPRTGELLMTVHLPAYQITSAAFGGPKLDELYVTTAAMLLTDKQKSERKLSGAVFRLTKTGSTGYAGVPVNLHLCPENQLDII